MPAVADAIVIAQDGDNYRVLVALQGGMGGAMTAIPVAVAVHGHADNVRGRFPPLPAVGTHGRVTFSRGDSRNGRWEGAHFPALTDASAHTSGHPNLDYTAFFDGGFDWRGEDGTAAKVFADGSSVLVGNALPQPTRHTLAADQSRQTVPFAAEQRNPNPPGPLPMTVRHASGAVVQINPAGQISAVDASGTAINMLNDGAVRITGQLIVSGEISDLNGVRGTLDALRTAYDAHTHVAPGGGGTTSGPTPVVP